MFWIILFIVVAVAVANHISAESERKRERDKLTVGSEEFNREASGIWDVDGR